MAIQRISSTNRAGTADPVQMTPRQAQAVPRASSAPVSSPSPEQLQQAMRDIQSVVASMASELNFSVDRESGKTVIRVVDSATQQLIRQIPSEEVMAISHALNRLAGLLMQEKV